MKYERKLGKQKVQGQWWSAIPSALQYTFFFVRLYKQRNARQSWGGRCFLRGDLRPGVGGWEPRVRGLEPGEGVWGPERHRGKPWKNRMDRCLSLRSDVCSFKRLLVWTDGKTDGNSPLCSSWYFPLCAQMRQAKLTHSYLLHLIWMKFGLCLILEKKRIMLNGSMSLN